VTRLAAYRTLWRAPLSNSSTEKLLEFSVKFFALSNQLFNADDLGVYVHLHHLPSPSEYIKRATASVLRIQELKTLAMFRYMPPHERVRLYDDFSLFIAFPGIVVQCIRRF